MQPGVGAVDSCRVTRRPAALHSVALVTRWDGFCLPCGSDARPLVLTWTGRRGLRAWLAGEGWHDGALRLTCVCCGGVDVVGWEDEPEPVLAVEEAFAPVAVPLAPAAPVTVVRVLDLDASVASVHELVPVPRTGAAPLGAADVDALDLLGLVG
ncbi:MAG: hypothetical protein JWM64_2551 [Frankiales bacterium]|nr:hypothetical protein [Frankiales bacterium]